MKLIFFNFAILEMDSKMIIDSGLLEAYILGATSAEEDLLVRAVEHERPVMLALKELSQCLEDLARENALEPPPYSSVFK